MWTSLAILLCGRDEGFGKNPSSRDEGFGKKLNIRWSLKQLAWGDLVTCRGV